jgi:hypothetical protein
MALDPTLIGSVINALPMDRMISGPLNAMITAQVSASRQYADFLLNVCIRDGKAIQVQFDYDETQVDTQGTVVGVVQKTMRVPLLAVVTHPNINVEEGSVDFELEVTQSEEEKTKTAVEAGLEASAGWGPFSAKLSAKVSHSKEQTRKTDTRAKYSFHTTIKRSGPPEGMMRVIDFLTDAATKPVTVPQDKKQLMPAPAPLAPPVKKNGTETKT